MILTMPDEKITVWTGVPRANWMKKKKGGANKKPQEFWPLG
jgi:hypothetical protein